MKYLLLLLVSTPALATLHYGQTVKVISKASFFYGSVGTLAASSAGSCTDGPTYVVRFEDNATSIFCTSELKVIK